MVPVNGTALARSFAAQLADFRDGIRESWHAEAPEAGLVEWAAFRSGTQLETGAEPLAVATIPARRRAEAPILAAVGFRLPLPAITDDAAGLWLDGMRRLMTATPCPLTATRSSSGPLSYSGSRSAPAHWPARTRPRCAGCVTFSNPAAATFHGPAYGPRHSKRSQPGTPERTGP